MRTHVLAIDQGTTGSTCLIVAIDGGRIQVVGRGYSEFPQYFPKPGWVEHDLNEIWNATCYAIRAALQAAKIEGANLAAIGITNQRETTGVWDRTGKPLHRAIVWQDRRTAPHCIDLARTHTEIVRKRTGLVLDPYFSGTKLAWLLNNVAGLRVAALRGEVRFGTIDTWLVDRLTMGRLHVTDATNASRTMLFDIHKGAWDLELCDAIGSIPRALLPEVRTSSEIYGRTAGCGVLPDGIPIAGIAGDQQAALFGQACLHDGMAKCTYGTGAFALINTGSRAVESKHGLLTTIAWRLGTRTTYALEGSAFTAGALVQWLRDGLQFFKSSAEVEALAAQVEDSGGVVVVPALTGLGAPHWRPEARGLIHGLTRGTTRAHIARAALEGIALQIHDLLDAMAKDAGQAIKVLRVDGGAAANNLLMQFQADVLGVTIHRPHNVDTTALGAAYLAALGAELCSLPEIEQGWAMDCSFLPRMAKEERTKRLEQWQAAVARA